MDEVYDNVAVDNPDWKTHIVRMDPAAATVYVPLHAVVADGQAYYSPQKANLVRWLMPTWRFYFPDCRPHVQRHIVNYKWDLGYKRLQI